MVGHMVKELGLPRAALVNVIVREGTAIPPRGSTVIQAGDELVLHYQPKIDPRTRRVVGVEALVRWAHPTHGLLYPDTFLPLAEQTGLMRQLTLVGLQTALRQGQAWRRDGLDQRLEDIFRDSDNDDRSR